MTFTVHNGDCRDIMAGMDAESVDSVVCDPPYGLSFMGKGWDHGIPGEEFWQAALRVAKPGAFLLAFGGTRTFHRLACAIEDAGWQMRDCIMWVYGSGFPKGKACLKPAWEPVIVARKKGPMLPLQIDSCRVGMRSKNESGWSITGSKSSVNLALSGPNVFRTPKDEANIGRWPANLIHDGSEEVLAGFPDEAGGGFGVRGAHTGEFLKSKVATYETDGFGDSGSAARFFYCAKASKTDRDDGLDVFALKPAGGLQGRNDGSMGSVTHSRNIHPTVKPTDLMRYLCRLVTPAGGTVLDPFTGSGSTGKAAVLEGFGFVGCELEPEYCRIAEARIAHAAAQGRLAI